MGPLANQRHECFAQALAQGKSAAEAYVLAGYKANAGNASWCLIPPCAFPAAAKADAS
jgi:hypothetical protein